MDADLADGEAVVQPLRVEILECAYRHPLAAAEVADIDAILLEADARPEGHREQGVFGVVDEEALIDALERNELAGVALDVFETEPTPKQSPILGLGDKVLLSPHMITHNKGTGLRIAVPWVEKAVMDALRGEIPRHVVNEDALPKWRARFEGKNLL